MSPPPSSHPSLLQSLFLSLSCLFSLALSLFFLCQLKWSPLSRDLISKLPTLLLLFLATALQFQLYAWVTFLHFAVYHVYHVFSLSFAASISCCKLQTLARCMVSMEHLLFLVLCILAMLVPWLYKHHLGPEWNGSTVGWIAMTFGTDINCDTVLTNQMDANLTMCHHSPTATY